MTDMPPYSPPKADVASATERGPRRDWRQALPAFLSALLLVPLVFVSLALLPGAARPDFMLAPGFIAALLGCATGAAWLLTPLRRTHWLVPALLAPPLAFLLLLLLVIGLKLFAG